MTKWIAKDNPTEVELAWAAGALDGEGCICIYGRPGRISKKGVHALQLVITLVNTDPRMPLKMKEIFGGNCQPAVERRGNPRRRPIMTWLITGKPAGLALAKMLPFLVIKREQAGIALAYVATIGKNGPLPINTHQKREEFRSKLVLLKGRIA